MAYDYTMDWSDGSLKPSFTLPGKTVDTTTTSLALTGKGTLNWGERLEENFLHLLEHFASNGIPPSHQTIGQLWYDNLAGKLNVCGDTAFDDVLKPLYDGIGSVDTASVLAGIAALKHPRIIKMDFLEGGWMDWWGGVNCVNFNGQSPTKSDMVNSWIPLANSISAGDNQGIVYNSSIAVVQVMTFKADQPCRLGLNMECTANFAPAQSLYSINWTYKVERSSDDGATWMFLPKSVVARTWGEVKDTAGNVVGYRSVGMGADSAANGDVRRTNNLIMPVVNPPDSGLTGHRIDSSGADQGAWIIDEPPFDPGFTYRFTLYASVGTMNNTVQLKVLATNMIFFLFGE